MSKDTEHPCLFKLISKKNKCHFSHRFNNYRFKNIIQHDITMNLMFHAYLVVHVHVNVFIMKIPRFWFHKELWPPLNLAHLFQISQNDHVYSSDIQCGPLQHWYQDPGTDHTLDKIVTLFHPIWPIHHVVYYLKESKLNQVHSILWIFDYGYWVPVNVTIKNQVSVGYCNCKIFQCTVQVFSEGVSKFWKWCPF
jgi:hypothetical protein